MLLGTFTNLNTMDNLWENKTLSMRFDTVFTTDEARGTYHHTNYYVDASGRQ